MPNGDDHDLLQRIDERVAAMRCEIQQLRNELAQAQQSISDLRVESAKWGGIAGIVSALIISLAVAGISAARGI